MPIKIVINTRHTRFSLSTELKRMYAESTKDTLRRENWSIYCVPRDDALLIRLIETIGLKRAGGLISSLKIVEIPDDVSDWDVVDDDGKEKVVERNPREWA